MSIVQLKKGLDDSYSNLSTKKKKKLDNKLINSLEELYDKLIFDENIPINRDQLLEAAYNTDDLYLEEDDETDRIRINNKAAVYELDSILKSELDLKEINTYNQQMNLIGGPRNCYTYAVGLKPKNNLYLDPKRVCYVGKGTGELNPLKPLDNQLVAGKDRCLTGPRVAYICRIKMIKPISLKVKLLLENLDQLAVSIRIY